MPYTGRQLEDLNTAPVEEPAAAVQRFHVLGTAQPVNESRNNSHLSLEKLNEEFFLDSFTGCAVPSTMNL